MSKRGKGKWRGILWVALGCFLLASGGGRAWSAEKELQAPRRSAKEYHAGDKLARGGLNMITFPAEIVRQAHLAASSGNQVRRIFGFIEGLGQALIRLAAGVTELLTFPFDFPDPDKAPLLEPAFVWGDE